MRLRLPLITLLCLMAVLHFERTDSLVSPAKVLGKAFKIKIGAGAPLAAVLTPKLGVAAKGLLFKPLALVALVKIKLALLLGKPILLLALKKLLLKPILGALLLKIPLILLPGAGFFLKLVAVKVALITKGLIGIKAPLALLVLAASALGSGIGLAVALGQLKEEEGYDDSYEAPYAIPQAAYTPPRPIYTPQVSQYGSYSSGSSFNPSSQFGGSAFGSSFGGFPSSGGYGSSYRRKRDAESDEDSNEDEYNEDDEEEVDIRTEFEAARSNGDAYLHLAAQLDEQSCGRRLICEVYQKPKGSLTADEVLIQEIFGYPLPELGEEERGSGRELYYRAAYIGAASAGRNANVCSRHFSACPYTSQQMINIFANEVDEDGESNAIDDVPASPQIGQQLAVANRYPAQVQKYQPLRYVAQNGAQAATGQAATGQAAPHNFVRAPTA